MSEKNWTPGPWSYNGSHIYAPDGEIIAQVHNPGRTPSDYPLEANRNVMATAPDLYDALENLVRNNAPEHVEAARAALAKARGAQ